MWVCSRLFNCHSGALISEFHLGPHTHTLLRKLAIPFSFRFSFLAFFPQKKKNEKLLLYYNTLFTSPLYLVTPITTTATNSILILLLAVLAVRVTEKVYYLHVNVQKVLLSPLSEFHTPSVSVLTSARRSIPPSLSLSLHFI